VNKSKTSILLLTAFTIGMLLPLTVLPFALAATNIYLPDYSQVVYGQTPVGIVHVRVDTDSNGSPDTWVETYCVTRDITINVPGSYSANISPASDNAENRAIAFILSWWHTPGTYSGTTNPGYSNAFMTTANAVSVANAIWSFTDNQDLTGMTDAQTIHNDANGRDVVRATDTLTLSKVSQTGIDITLKAKVTKADTTARPNIMVIFKATGVQSVSGLLAVNEWNPLDLLPTYNYKGYTDSAGEIIFTITINPAAQTTQIDAYTQGIWPNIIDPVNGAQEFASASLTTTLVVKTASFVVPEYALGGLMAVGAALAAFAVYKKKHHPIT
jgi:hypothetical protein